MNYEISAEPRKPENQRKAIQAAEPAVMDGKPQTSGRVRERFPSVVVDMKSETQKRDEPRVVEPYRFTPPKSAVELLKDDKIARLVGYYKSHGEWPSPADKDLGMYLDRIRKREIRVPSVHRAALQSVDPHVFDVTKRASGGKVVRGSESQITTTPSIPLSPASSAAATSTTVPVVAPPKAMSKDDQIALLVAYHQQNGTWPASSYKDAETSAALGSFLDKAISRQIHLTDDQKAQLLEVDPNVFGRVKKAPAKGSLPAPASTSTTTSTLTSTTPSKPSPKKLLSKDTHVELLVSYYQKHGSWPAFGYKDPETRASLGLFLNRAISRQVSLTDDQRAKLSALDPDLFGVNKKALVKTPSSPAVPAAITAPATAAAPTRIISTSTITTTTTTTTTTTASTMTNPQSKPLTKDNQVAY